MDYYLNQEEAIELFCRLVGRHLSIPVEKLDVNETLLFYLGVYSQAKPSHDLESLIEQSFKTNRNIDKRKNPDDDEQMHARQHLSAQEKRRITNENKSNKFSKQVWKLSLNIREGRPVWISDYTLHAFLNYINDDAYKAYTKCFSPIIKLDLSPKRNIFSNTNWKLFFWDDFRERDNERPKITKGISVATLKLGLFGKAELHRGVNDPYRKEIRIYIGRYRFYDNGKFLSIKMKLAGSRERDLRLLFYIGSEPDIRISTGMGANISYDSWARILVIQKVQKGEKLTEPGFFSKQIENKRNSEIPDYIWSFFANREENIIRVPHAGISIDELYTIIESRKVT